MPTAGSSRQRRSGSGCEPPPPNLKGRDIREAFQGGEYQVLLAANKFQTGFDQPLLCGMYVDKRLAGIQAVQTLSRLNRAYLGKDTTYILDFVNKPEDILQAFKTWKLLESPTLTEQASNNTKEQFANSPDLDSELQGAIMAAYDAHTLMSTQALNSKAVQQALKDILLNHALLWEALRDKTQRAPPGRVHGSPVSSERKVHRESRFAWVKGLSCISRLGVLSQIK